MKKELWIRLSRYHFANLVPPHLTDHVIAAFGGADASTKAFVSKLARKLGWTTTFSLRAIGEYKKFVYLGNVSESSVTPPKVIDQVWHEHLLFSRPYREFCRDVVGRDFDHNPELVATPKQTDLFEAQFCATLDLYYDEFNLEAPDDIWGTPKFRTARARLRRVPRKRDADSSSFTSSSDDAPLYVLFSSSGSDASSHGVVMDFGGGGGFSGGGGGAFWGGDSSDSNQANDSGAGDSGSDSGSSDGGGSSCSSSCGGGGCSS